MEATEVIPSPFGLIEITATPRGISRIRVLRRITVRLPCSNARPCPRARDHIDTLRDELRAYFEGKDACFSVPLDLSAGTPFQRRVWRSCAQIPRGQVWSYRQVGALAGYPRAARAVGQAMAANPVPIVIPCHRVIRADGSLGGYGPGVWLKKKLLRFEGAL